MLKKLLYALTSVACLTILTSCEHETHAASEQTALPVQVRTPAVVERAESVSASGSVEGSETADVAFQVGGRVARVLAAGPAPRMATVLILPPCSFDDSMCERIVIYLRKDNRMIRIA